MNWIKNNRELTVGLMVIAAVAILFFGVNYLKGVNVLKPSNYYYAKFDNINGLLESSQITSRGYGIGNVHQIEYNYKDPKDGVVVVLKLDDELTIPMGSRVLLNSKLMGGAELSLDLNFDGSGKYYQKGDTIASLAVPGMLDAVSEEIMPRVAEIIPQLDSLLLSIRAITESQKLTSALNNFNDMSHNLKTASVKLNTIMDRDITPFMADAKVTMGNISAMSSNLSQIDFKLTFTKVNTTLDNVNGITNQINNGSGTISLLLKDPELYNNLTATANSANSLLRDVEANPKKYVQFSLIERKQRDKNKKEDAK